VTEVVAADLKRDGERLARFLFWAGSAGAMCVPAIVAYAYYYPGPLLSLLSVTLSVYSVSIFVSSRWAKRGRIDSAITLYVAGSLQFAFCFGLAGPRYYSLTLMGLFSLILAVPYVSLERLRRIAFVTASVIVSSTIPWLMGFEVGLGALPESKIDAGLSVGVPGIMVVLIAAIWQSRLALSEASTHLSEANEALRKSERQLEEKVLQRTRALQDSQSELAVARDEAVAANRHKSAFLANMSHELRTPLNAVIGFSEVLLEKVFGELNDKQNEYLGDIHFSGRHLLSLINDILDLSKIEAGRLELSPSTVAIGETMDSAIVLMRERANRDEVSLLKEVAPDIGTVFADERKLKQVLINLLSNAVKFTKQGGTVTLRARRDGNDLEISVVDTGIGIAPKDQALIFEEFRQAGEAYAKAQEGTGLGLALTKRLVELHGGKIWLESELGTGSTFTLRIPVEGNAVVAEEC
jgi:signal transduction histidine kinase